MIPLGDDAALAVGFTDRFFDNYVMSRRQTRVADAPNMLDVACGWLKKQSNG